MKESSGLEGSNMEVITDEIEFSGPGRPFDQRTLDLYEIIKHAIDNGDFGVRVDLLDDETGKFFYRFSQRARSAAKRAGIKVNVSAVRADPTKGNIRLLSEV